MGRWCPNVRAWSGVMVVRRERMPRQHRVRGAKTQCHGRCACCIRGKDPRAGTKVERRRDLTDAAAATDPDVLSADLVVPEHRGSGDTRASESTGSTPGAQDRVHGRGAQGHLRSAGLLEDGRRH